MDTPSHAPHNSNSLTVGYQFNDEYEIIKVIGEGGFGIVYLAYDNQLHRTVAIKEYMPISLAKRNPDNSIALRSERFEKSFNAGFASFENEARLLAQFNHPSLLHVYRFWRKNNTSYMATQFYSGMTLKKYRANHSSDISEEWIKYILPHLLDAIRTLHDKNCLHRDISLDNIMLQENGIPVLLDFGSAKKTIGNLADQTEIMLKPGFAPIEQYSENNSNEQGPWTDIYALAAVLHALIIGSPPPVSIVRCIEDSYIPLTQQDISGYSIKFLAAIDHALTIKFEDRPQNIIAFAKELGLLKSNNTIDLPDIVIDDDFKRKIGSSWNISKIVQQIKKWINDYDLDANLIMKITIPVVGIVLAIGAYLLFTGSDVEIPKNKIDPAEIKRVADIAAKNTADSVMKEIEDKTTIITPPPALEATIYIKIAVGDTIMLNDKPLDLTALSSDVAKILVPLGNHKLTITQGEKINIYNIGLAEPGTWIMTSPNR